MQPPLSPVPVMPSLRPVAPPPVDMTLIAEAFDVVREFLTPMAAVMREAGRRLTLMQRHAGSLANDPVRLAGLEARYAVRAGLDPDLREPFALDALVRVILDYGGPDDDWLAGLITPANRRRLAVAAIRGWVASYVKRGA